MKYFGSILIADNDAIFSNSTSDLLKKKGYTCDTAGNHKEATKLLQENIYDLLISDIRMPGNENLELVFDLQNFKKKTLVILTAELPTVDSAIKSINLPVLAYLRKPLELDDFFMRVESSMKSQEINMSFSYIINNMSSCVDRVNGFINSDAKIKIGDNEAVFDVVFQTLRSCIRRLLSIEIQVYQRDGHKVCGLLDCDKRDFYKKLVNETIDILEKTKNHFKSRELGELRKKLKNDLKMGCNY